MRRVIRNPHGIDDPYLECLNVCFSGKWCPDSYHWYLKRSFGGRSPDIVALYEGDELAAGIGINYRQLSLHGDVCNVAILTAAWTLPKFRGRWHLANLIRASREVAREKGCIAVLSFVTARNASAKVLERCGAYAVPTRYLRSSAGQKVKLPEHMPEILQIKTADSDCGHANGSAISFRYASDEDWRAQFISRPHPVVTLNVESATVVVEATDDTDRLQYISDGADDCSILAAMVRDSQRKHRHFFCFTTSETLATSAARMGMSVEVGYMMIVDVPPESAEDDAAIRRLRALKWKVQPGDRM